MPYRAPLGDIQFILDQVVPLAPVAATGRYAEATPDLVEAILTEAARLCDTVMAPLQRAGDLHPARLENGAVRSTPASPRPSARSRRAAGSVSARRWNMAAWACRRR